MWNEPNIDFWAPPKEEKQATYFRLYEETARAVKRAHPRLRVGGPVTAGSPAWIADLIAYCRNRSVPLDFISSHVYSGGDVHINDVASIEHGVSAGIAAAGSYPILFTEFGSSYKPGGASCAPYCNATTATCHDTYEASAFLARTFDTFTSNASKYGSLQLLSYWSISDIFEEEGLPTINASFAGDFGLINPFGVPKPAYRLLQLLNYMGDTRLPLNVTAAGPCAATVGGLASRNATHLLALLYSQARLLP